MKLVLVIKTQGENRERGADGKLRATQPHWLKPAVVVDGSIVFLGNRGKTIGQCQETAEKVFGPLKWLGFPEFLEITRDLKIPEIKSAAILPDKS